MICGNVVSIANKPWVGVGVKVCSYSSRTEGERIECFVEPNACDYVHGEDLVIMNQCSGGL